MFLKADCESSRKYPNPSCPAVFFLIKSISILDSDKNWKNMFQKYKSAALIGLLLHLIIYSTVIAAAQNDAKSTENIKADIAAHAAAAHDSKITIKLKDGSKLKGYISSAKDVSFVLTNEETGKSTEISYLQVKQVKKRNSSNGKKIFVRATIIVGVIFLYGLYLSRSSEY